MSLACFLRKSAVIQFPKITGDRPRIIYTTRAQHGVLEQAVTEGGKRGRYPFLIWIC